MSDRESRFQRGLEDLWFFCQEVLEMPVKEKPHREMIEFLAQDGHPSKLLLVPRDCWKTSIGAQAFPLWKCLRAYFLDGNPAYRCMVDSSTVQLSQFVLGSIAQWLQACEPLKDLYGNLYDRKATKEKWMSLSFRREGSGGIKEPNFFASGINAAKTGLHFDLIVLDDLVTKENYQSLPMREKTWLHYRMMYGILEADNSGQKTYMHIAGTRYHDDDLYGRIFSDEEKRVAEGEEPSFVMMTRAAIENGELFYPDVLNHKELDRRRSNMKGLFWAQYMNDPNSDTAPFKAEQLKWHSLDEFPKALQMIRLTCDAAIKEEAVAHGDYNAIVVAGWDRYRNPWILDVDMRRDLTVGAMIDMTLDMAFKWQVEMVIIEERSGDLLFPLFQQEMLRRKRSVPIYMVKPNGLAGKMTRWGALQPFAERAGLRIAKEIPESTKLEIEEEWSRAPFARFDDFMDALELQLTFLAVDETGAGERPTFPERDPMKILDGVETTERMLSGADVFPHLRQLTPRPDGSEEPDDYKTPKEYAEEGDLEVTWQ